MKFIIFLDFDGVTHTQPCFSKYYFNQLHLIEEVLREFPFVQIVISSSWREHYDLPALRHFFSDDINERVIDVTPFYRSPARDHLTRELTEFERQWEVEMWCKENGIQRNQWIAIDDYKKWFEPNFKNLLLTSDETGFTLQDQHVLRSMIKERL